MLKDLGREERRYLLNLAYRLLGSFAEAEDIVQEASIRWCALTAEERAALRSPRAWLTTVASRLCFDLLESARHRRERHAGVWLPEPIPEDPFGELAQLRSPLAKALLSESLSMAFLVMLEALTPAERVAWVLHEVFEYGFAEISGVLGRTPGASRQLASSARRKLSSCSTTVRGSVNPEVISAFRVAWEERDVETMARLLDPESVAIVDGGGLVSAEPEPLNGPIAIAKGFVGVFQREPALEIALARTGGQPGLVALANGELRAVIAVAGGHSRIGRLWVVRDPRKLTKWSRSCPAERISRPCAPNSTQGSDSW